MEDNIRGGEDAVEVDEDDAIAAGKCWECSGEQAGPSAAYIGGWRQVPEVTNVVGVGRTPRAG